MQGFKVESLLALHMDLFQLLLSCIVEKAFPLVRRVIVYECRHIDAGIKCTGTGP